MEEPGRPETRRERLEVPSSTALERRLLVGDVAPRRPRHKPTIKPVPPSGLLDRLQAFLPTLEAANADLQHQLETGGGEQVAMERGSDDEREGPYVEMDLACGLFDLKDPAAVAAAEAAMVNRGVAVEAYGAGSGNSSSDDTSDDSSDSGGSDAEGSRDEGERMRQALGIMAAAQQRQRDGGQRPAAAGAVAPAGGDAMDEDAPAPPPSSETAAAAAEGAAELGDGASAAAPPGRRRKHKGGRRHAGIVELS
ncbi:hypothetical protein ABPG77_002901 [Micractinium sp. CCAP 211/92]